MDDPQNIPGPIPPEEPADPSPGLGDMPAAEPGIENPPESTIELSAAIAPRSEPSDYRRAEVAAQEHAAQRRRSFRHNLFLLLSLVLSAFILTSWILVRVDSPFGVFSTGPQEVVRAQLRALDRGELRPAYDMFSPRYRGQVSFDNWHELFVTHWRMFHADVVRSESPAFDGPGVTLQIYLHGADDKDYRARFTLIRTEGRWWIDDVHWTQEPDESDVSKT
jgi:hypothetical protein